MMLYPSMPSLLQHTDSSRYLLVNVIAKSAREIADDAREAGEQLDEKPVSLAVQRIAEGKVKNIG